MPEDHPDLLPDSAMPLGIFLSYASEDRDIVEVFAQQFAVLNQELRESLKVFRDTSNIRLGHNISEEIKDALRASEYLIVFYTGQLKHSFSWTGVELGFYLSLMDSDKRIPRKIVSVYFGDPPENLGALQGISLQVSPADLSLPPKTYAKEVRSNEQLHDSGLARLFKEIAGTVRARFPTDGSYNPELERSTITTIKKIEEEIVPRVVIGMHACLGRRIASRSIEQKLLEIEIEQFDISQPLREIPPEAKLTAHNSAFGLFGLEGRESVPTWSEFQTHLQRTFPADAEGITRAIERVFHTAVAPQAVDNDQVMRSPVDQKTYRVIATRHFDYFNGKKVVHLYLIEVRRSYEFGSSIPSLLVSFINVSSRYRLMFLELESEFSPQAFAMLHARTKLEALVQKLLQELSFIEDDSARLMLNGPKAAAALWGHQCDLSELGAMTAGWARERAELQEAAHALLNCGDDEQSFLDYQAAWLKQLVKFTSFAGAINKKIGLQALEALKVYYEGDGP